MAKKHKRPGRPSGKWGNWVAVDEKSGETCVLGIHEQSVGKWVKFTTPRAGNGSCNIDWTSFSGIHIHHRGMHLKLLRLWLSPIKSAPFNVLVAKMSTISPLVNFDKSRHESLVAVL